MADGPSGTAEPAAPAPSNRRRWRELPFLIGQLSVYPSIPKSYKEYNLTQHWIHFEAESTTTPLDGTLNWEVAVAFDPVAPIRDDYRPGRYPYPVEFAPCETLVPQVFVLQRLCAAVARRRGVYAGSVDVDRDVDVYRCGR